MEFINGDILVNTLRYFQIAKNQFMLISDLLHVAVTVQRIIFKQQTDIVTTFIIHMTEFWFIFKF